MKKILLLIILMIPLVYAVPECGRFQVKTEIPCKIISSYSPASCYVNATVVNESNAIVQNLTWQNYSINCFAYFNITKIGTYQYTGVEEGIITVEEDSNMLIGLVVGICSIVGLLLWLAFKLEEQFGILKLILVFVSVGLIGLIPAIFIVDNTNVIFYKAMMWFIVIFWLYVAGHFIWWLYEKMRTYVPK